MIDIPLADTPMTWRCPCGHRPWAHAEFCACGAPRPPPAPLQPTDDVSRPDPLEDLSGAPWRLLGRLARVVQRDPKPWVPGDK